MLDERSQELINAGLDGELSASDRHELDNLLASSPDARAASDELKKLAGLLAEAPELDPPPGLSGQILERIELPQRRRFSDWFKLSPQATPATYGLAFAAGLLLAVGFYELAPEPLTDGDMSGMVGTMTGRKAQAQTLPVESGVIEGMVSLSSRENVLVLEFDLDSSQVVGINVNLAGTGLSFGGITQAESGIDSLEISAGGMQFENQGRQQFAVFLHEESSAAETKQDIEIDFTFDGMQIFEGELSLR